MSTIYIVKFIYSALLFPPGIFIIALLLLAWWRRRDRRLALLYASQDAAEGLRVGQRALVLLLGRVVESADSAALAALDTAARHPYTRALIDAAGFRRPSLRGDPPSALRPPTGCALRLRCPQARDYCAQAAPALEKVGPGHRVACHYWDMDESVGGDSAGADSAGDDVAGGGKDAS